jgi:hypothetical protein
MSRQAQISDMAKPPEGPEGTGQIAKWIRTRIKGGGERLWRFDDFSKAPVSAVAQALSRLARDGELERLSKGVYYRSRQTPFGKSTPNPAAIQELATTSKAIFPAGIAAANLLGFTTQTAARAELATSGFRLPRKLLGQAVVHTRRPDTWAGLSDMDAALLDLLRHAGKGSELSPGDTVRHLLRLCAERGRFKRLLRIAVSEPPRVRAMLGAIGQQLGMKPSVLRPLRDSLNPVSRFDFGMLDGLQHAKSWQAKGRRP